MSLSLSHVFAAVFRYYKSVTNLINMRTGHIEDRARARSISNSIYKNLELREERDSPAREQLLGSKPVTCDG
jgi:hypothetical protein